jgi:hypothetical protein
VSFLNLAFFAAFVDYKRSDAVLRALQLVTTGVAEVKRKFAATEFSPPAVRDFP